MSVSLGCRNTKSKMAASSRSLVVVSGTKNVLHLRNKYHKQFAPPPPECVVATRNFLIQCYVKLASPQLAIRE